MNGFPDYIAQDLARRGISETLAQRMGIVAAGTPEASAYPPCYPPCNQGFLIPYLNLPDKYARRRNLSKPLPLSKDGKEAKYSAPVKANHLYWLPMDGEKMRGAKHQTVMLWTEGEIKTAILSETAARLDTATVKYAAIGGGGVWNFQSASNLDAVFLEHFREIPVIDRQHVLFFDADAESNMRVRQAAYRLAALLVQRGVSLKHVTVALWKSEDGKGIDDYLQQQPDPAAALRVLLDAAQPVFVAYSLDLESAVKSLAVPGLQRQHLSQLTGALAKQYYADAITKTDIRLLLQEALKRITPSAPRPQDVPEMSQASVFWREAVDATGEWRVTINQKAFLAFLADRGFGILRKDDRLIFVRIQDKIVSENLIEHGENIDIKRLTFDHLQQCRVERVENMMLKYHAQFFTLAALNTLPYVAPVFCKDTQESAFLFFKNGFVHIRVDRTTKHAHPTRLRPYADLPGHIWERQILSRAYCGATDGVITPQLAGEFFEFFRCVTAQKRDSAQPFSAENRQDDHEKMSAFLSAFGYLLHGWKDVTLSRAVVCVDNSLGYIDDDGRTGKSLFCESLKHLKNVHTESGKAWNVEDRFAFQNITLDTQIVFVDDISPKFNFKALYPAITGDLSCESKNIRKITIVYDESPKFLLTSNNPVKGEGESDLARQWILPFSRFFSSAFTPKDYFTHRLFVDWDDAEWQRFFDFAVCALGFYLTHGYLEFHDPEFERAKLLTALPEEALVLFDGLERNASHEKNAVKDALSFDVSGKMFTKYAKIYAKYHDLNYDERETSVMRSGIKQSVVMMRFRQPVSA